MAMGMGSHGRVTVVVTYKEAGGENLQILLDERRMQLTT
uniref:Uncharacterized protein n=1 Tax=Romanomermis culicivorax TaxID=13658 RepID=A0A915KGE2_ROMCU